MVGSKTLMGVALALSVGCGEAAVLAPQTVPSAPPVTTAPAALPNDPFVLPAGPRDEPARALGPLALRLDAWDSASKAKGLAAPPAECAAYAKRAADKTASGDPAADLLTALATKDAAKADALLVSVEAKRDASDPGVLRALRADLAPGPCGDVIVDPYVAAHRGTESRAAHVLIGLSLAAKLARTGTGKPEMGPVKEKEKVKAFIGGPLKTWMVEQSTAIETLASGAAGLTGYGRGVAALEAGIADLRLVEIIRNAPIPPSWDPELKAIYQSSLDEALEPRKKRGRDAALVGLGDLANAGVAVDARTTRAHALLTSLYGGRRIGALSELMVPRPADPTPSGARQAALGSLSPFWADVLALDPSDDAEAPFALLRGASAAARARLGASNQPETRAAYARARFRMGQVSWRRVDFVEAAYAAKAGAAPEDRLVLALSLALAQGPNGAAEMMRAPSAAALDLRHTEALDALASGGGPLAGWAAFDAAHLRSLSPPDGAASAPYFRDVALRFRNAGSLLMDPSAKKQALRRAEEADAIVAATAKP